MDTSVGYEYQHLLMRETPEMQKILSFALTVNTPSCLILRPIISYASTNHNLRPMLALSYVPIGHQRLNVSTPKRLNINFIEFTLNCQKLYLILPYPYADALIHFLESGGMGGDDI